MTVLNWPLYRKDTLKNGKVHAVTHGTHRTLCGLTIEPHLGWLHIGYGQQDKVTCFKCDKALG